MKTTYTCRDARCPRCSSDLTGASDPQSDATPSPDDLSVCVYCGAVLVFNHDMTMRLAEPDDIQTLELDAMMKLLHYSAAIEVKRRIEREAKNAKH
jgi:hypothetical protein